MSKVQAITPATVYKCSDGGIFDTREAAEARQLILNIEKVLTDAGLVSGQMEKIAILIRDNWPQLKALMEPESVDPIPAGVYFSMENFYSASPFGQGMGLDFYNKWWPRRGEFPTSANEART